MKAILITVLLVSIDCGLALALGRQTASATAPEIQRVDRPVIPSARKQIRTKSKGPPPPATEYAAIYSSNSKQFVANLRAIECPEETINDILIAEITRRYAAQEEALRPTPADHVPYGWSAKTVEGKLIARRQEAAGIARSKAAELRESLGYDVPLTMPHYAMTASDEAFERFLGSLAPEKRAEAQQIQERYWAEVEQLRDRTRGFWLAEDVAALNQLKGRRQAALDQLSGR